ncbi:MAG TPA: hypothetical protein VJM11_11895 [Nevskiaceae bacterium]|nr:hypothetical protein [Nevskiaceae bacterium]
MIRSIACLLALVLLAGCTKTYKVGLPYRPTTTTAPAPLKVSSGGVGVGTFQDRRGTDPRWVGAVRGRYGNLVKRLLSVETTPEVIRESLVNALDARGVRASTDKADVWIEGQILKLDCSYLFNKEAHAHIAIRVLSASRAVVFTQTYRTDNEESGRWAGRWADVNALAQFEQRTVNETIDKMFADPKFVAALSGAKR